MPQQFSSYKHRRDLNQTQKISAEKEKKRKKNLPLPLRASVEKPLSCSGHFLLDRSQREQLSMRVTHMIDSLLCQGPAGPFEHGDIHLEPPPPPTPRSPVQFISSVLSQIKSRPCQSHFHSEAYSRGTARGLRSNFFLEKKNK